MQSVSSYINSLDELAGNKSNQPHKWIYYFPSGKPLVITDIQQHRTIPVILGPIYIIQERDKLGSQITRYNLLPKTRGGSIFSSIMNSVVRFIFKIFDPIIKPLRAITNCILLLVKWVLYMVAAFTWIIKLHVWFFLTFLPSLPADIMVMVKNLSVLLFDATIGVCGNLIRKGVNKLGNVTVKAVAGGWDNVPDAAEDKEAKYFDDDTESKCKPGYKCYKSADGTIPFSVIIATVLCPPIGVFMEYGITGWVNILVCALLTLVFYFPGLIYALILLYC